MGWRVRLTGSFYPLFVLLLVSLVFTVGASDHAWAAIVGQALATASLLFTLRASRPARSWTAVGWAVFAVGIAGALLQGLLELRALRAVVGVVFIVLLFASIPLILRRVAAEPRITAETIVGALCAYLLIGMDFAVLHGLLSVIEGQPIIASIVSPGADITRGDLYYHSFMTMTTVGYGDFVPSTGSAKTLALLEGILGQLFLVTVVARLVSVATIRRPKPVADGLPQSPAEPAGPSETAVG